jgi:hypothetical protein
MIFADALPQIKSFLRPAHWAPATVGLRSNNWAVLHDVTGLLPAEESRRDGTWIFFVDQTWKGNPRRPRAVVPITLPGPVTVTPHWVLPRPPAFPVTSVPMVKEET